LDPLLDPVELELGEEEEEEEGEGGGGAKIQEDSFAGTIDIFP